MAKELWDPFDDLRQEVDDLFKDFSGRRKGLEVQRPFVDIEDKGKELLVTAELPGIDKKDIDVNVEEDRIEIKAKKEKETEIKKKDFYRKERAYGDFYRALPLPVSIKPDKAKAKFDNGVLKVILPKAKGKEVKGKSLSIE